MTASKPATPTTSDELIVKSDLARIDAHVVEPEEYDEIPEITDEMMARADFHIGGKLIRRGRPPSPAPKRLVSIRLDPDVLDGLRATGPGWQTRLNEIARDWLKGQAA